MFWAMQMDLMNQHLWHIIVYCTLYMHSTYFESVLKWGIRVRNKWLMVGQQTYSLKSIWIIIMYHRYFYWSSSVHRKICLNSRVKCWTRFQQCKYYIVYIVKHSTEKREIWKVTTHLNMLQRSIGTQIRGNIV